MKNFADSLYIGAMSGTSVDGLDLALVDIRTSGNKLRIEIVNAKTFEIPSTLRDNLLSLGQPEDDDLDQLGQCDRLLGQFIADSINGYLKLLGADKQNVIAIGCHGQTIRHRPPGELTTPFTLQIGDPNSIAEITGITTVADFRRRDVAAGGQGAPLTPAFHKILFGDTDANIAVLNIGGIGNLTIFDNDRLIGFDTGPGNGLLDQWCQIHKGEPFDQGGSWAATGTICEELLQSCLQDPYFALPPPKSTGREYFNLAWLEQHIANQKKLTPISPEDVQATLVELSALSIARSLNKESQGLSAVAVCGGGRLNAFMMHRLAVHCQHILVKPTEHWGVDGDSLEAAAFAWLAYQRMNNLPGNIPSVTGAKGERILGAIFPGESLSSMLQN